MSVLADCHLHSHHSGDSDAPMEEMVLKGIESGLKAMCFTEHNDFDYPPAPGEPADLFELNADSYLYELLGLKEKYADRIKLLFGLELGLQPQVFRENAVFARSHEYDFIIGSSHICHGKDPYYPAFFEGRSDEEAYREYFESELENIRKFSNFDVYGHLDYVVRYGAARDSGYSYDKYKDILDTILETLLEKEKGIELNTGALRNGMKDFNPCKDVLKRYRELGGEIITVGSDAHRAQDIGSGFGRAAEVLQECGFKYYTVFEKRLPEYIRL
ncbi:MAG: histidinol-phosphatase HisJ family protein [Clostridium sp.]|nr:histidinol-phosphatase HisJ family protein [Acetatifactor muris]MCM1526068.1 histidinol-phosphatase HisJ family protein [Bacteroides sp.]MCM1562172.1 histidinol-phosphatase HisJ family protein [Clostridium sp.]